MMCVYVCEERIRRVESWVAQLRTRVFMAGPMFPRSEREIYYRNINHIQGGRMYFLLLFNIGMDESCKVDCLVVSFFLKF